MTLTGPLDTDFAFPPPPLWGPVIISLNCTTRILWVADGSLNFSTSGFGLSEAADIVANAANTNYQVELVTAHRTSGTADVINFTFDGTHTVNGVSRTIDDYEEIWLFGWNATPMPAAEIAALEAFMDAGGGVFATGDHSTLGAGMSGSVQRLQTMRLWDAADSPPSGSDPATRIDTNVPNGAVGPEFDLQSDDIAQRIYPKWYDDGGAVLAHELLRRHDVDGPVTFLPDHPHEGEVVEPAVLDPAEYPGGVAPEIVAWGVSGGSGTEGGKLPVTPRLFGVIGAYDGHQADVGRIVVDSTWHHWVNINLNGTGAGAFPEPTDGLYDGANPTPEYEQIQDYFQNIAGWLEPNRLRICFIVIWWPCFRYAVPIAQEFDFRGEPDIRTLTSLGRYVLKSLSGRRGGSAEELVSLLTADLDLSDEARTFLDPTWKRNRKLRNLVPSSPLVDRSAVQAAVVGGSMWQLAQELPEDEEAGVEFVTKALRIDGDDHDTSKLWSIITEGAALGLKLAGAELGPDRSPVGGIAKILG